MNRSRRVARLTALVCAAGLIAAACTNQPPNSGSGSTGGSSYTFRATKVHVVSHNDAFLQGTRDEPFVYNLWFRVKVGQANSAQVGISGSRDSASMSLGDGESRYLFSDAEQGAVRFDNVRSYDALDLVNPQNHLEIVGSWTWAMEEDNISVRGLADQASALLKTALNNTLATMTLPSDTGTLVSQLLAAIPNPFTFFVGAALASIPGLTDDAVGSNVYVGIAATGVLADALDAATASVSIPFIEIPVVSIPPDIGLNPGGGGHIFTLRSPRTFTGEDFSQWNSGHHRYDIQMVRTGTPLDLTQIYNARYARCVDLSYGNADGGLVDPWPCNGNGRQAWILNAQGQILTPVKSGRCLDAGSGAANNTVSSQGCNGSAGQMWRVNGSQIVNQAQNMCLAIPGQPISGTNLRLRPCASGDTEQEWQFQPLAAGSYRRIRQLTRDRCAGVDGADQSNGAGVSGWMCTNAPDQGWMLDPSGFILNRGSDRCLDGNGGQAGATVLIWNCADVPWQRWEWTGTQLVNTYRTTCLAILNNDELPGGRMSLVTCDPNDPSQRITMEPAAPWPWHRIANPSSGDCAEITDNNSSNGTRVRRADCAGYQATGQGWKLDATGMVFSRIDDGAHGKCLDASTGANGSEVLVWDCHGGNNQRWHVDGQQLVNNVAGMCLQAPSNDGETLTVATCDGSARQRWALNLQ